MRASGLVVLALLLAPTALAAPVALDVRTGAPVEAEGDVAIALERAQGFWVGAGGGDAAFELREGTLEVHTWRRARAPSFAGSLEDASVERIDVRAARLALTLAPEDDGGFVLASEGRSVVRGLAQGEGTPQTALTATRESGTPLPRAPWPSQEPSVAWAWSEDDAVFGEYADLQYQVQGFPRVRAPVLELDGPFVMELNAGELRVGDRAFRLGNFTEPGTPDGPAGVRRYVRAILVADGVARLPLPPAWALAAPRAEVALDGSLRLADATGTVRVADATHALRGEDAMLRGALRLEGARDAVEATLAGEGDADLVRIDGRTVHVQQPPVAPARAVAPALAGLALLLVALKVAAVLYTRIRADALLTHPTRSAIYAAVVAEPGIHFRALHRIAGCAYGPFLFHTRLLREAGYLRFQRAGRYLQAFATGAAESPAAIPNPVARAVLAAVPAGARAGPTEVAARAGVSRQLASYHLRRLERAGLVRRDEDGFERLP